jgi:purine-binding chemotaxis protein CheW
MPDSVNPGQSASIQHHNQLVQSYLDSLLCVATAVAEEEDVVEVSEIADQQATTEEAIGENGAAVIEQAVLNDDVALNQAALITEVNTEASTPSSESISTQEIEDQTKQASQVASDEVMATTFVDDPELLEEIGEATGRPDWADDTFASLLFEVAGNDLAAPLHELGGICPLTDNLKFLAGQADWFLGLLNWNGRQLRVVDTAKLLMSESLLDGSFDEDYQSVIILGNSNWALAVNRADQSIRLDPEKVKWREHRGSRPWLAGTLQEQLSSLIDVSALRHQLDRLDLSLNGDSTDKPGTDPAS